MAVLTFQGEALNHVAKTALQNRAKIFLIKDDGIYLIVHGKNQKAICYAVGYDPKLNDDIDDDVITSETFQETLPFEGKVWHPLSRPGHALRIKFSDDAMTLDVFKPQPSRDDIQRGFAKNGIVVLHWKSDTRITVQKGKAIFDLQRGRGRKWNAIPGSARQTN